MSKNEKLFLLIFIYCLVAFSASTEIWSDVFWGVSLLCAGFAFVNCPTKRAADLCQECGTKRIAGENKCRVCGTSR
jgi:hypothetical protein